MVEIPKPLIEQIKEGNVVLFLGSGATIGAKHPVFDKAPIGGSLADLIVDKYFDSSYSGSDLQYISELAMSETNLFEVQSFIKDIFEPFEPGSHHLKIPLFSWKAVFTTNYDLVLEKSYKAVGERVQNLIPVIRNTRVQDINKTEKSLPYFKLHGCVSHTNDKDLPLILTPEQYITHLKNRDRLFNKLLELAYDYTFLFVGFSFADQDIRSILLKTEEVKEGRPRFYMVGPFIKGTEERLWEGKKITSIKCAFQEFIETLDTQIDENSRKLSTARPKLDYPIYKKFALDIESLRPSESFINFLNNEIEFVHEAIAAPHTDPKMFYKGYFETWDPIIKNLDVNRSQKDDILSETFLDDEVHAEVSQNLYVVKGHAGSGKSVLLKRLAWDASTSFDRICIFYKANAYIKYEPIYELYNYCKERIYIFVDNLSEHIEEIKHLFSKAKKDNLKLSLLGSVRTNVWNTDCEAIINFVSQEYTIRYLTDGEIKELLVLLRKHDSLGYLANKSFEDQVHELSYRAGRELLVALYEATYGKPFSEIIFDEYKSINDRQAKSLYLTVCILHRLGALTRAGLISRVHGLSFSEFKNRLFKPLEFIVFDQRDYRINDFVYLTRHKYIAEIVFETVLINVQDKYDEYMRIISCLDVDYESDRTAFFSMTNAKKLQEIFPDPNMIRNLYEAASKVSIDDAKLYQQRAINEMTLAGGSFFKADEYLKKAYTLSPGDPVISHTFAEMALKKAEKARYEIERTKHLDEAKEICQKLLNSHLQSPHPYHTLVKVNLAKLHDVLNSDDGISIEKSIKETEKSLTQAKQLFPEEEFILEAESKFNALMDNAPKAKESLTKAFSVNKASPYLCLRLAALYESESDIEKAIAVLKETLEVNPGEKDVNFKLGMLLSELPNPDNSEVKHYLRRSFTLGDIRYQSQFWYARTLYILNEFEPAKEIFKLLRTANVNPEVKNRPTGILAKGNKPIDFYGTIIKLEASYGFIRRDGFGDTVYFLRLQDAPEMSSGQRVGFNVAFNYRGPIATNIKI